MPLNLQTIDPSIIPTKQNLPDFGAIPAGISQIMNIQKNKVGIAQAQQQMAANQAVSQAIQQNTDQNGNVNIPQIMQALSQDPNAAYNLPQIGTQLQQMEGAKYTALNAKIDNARKENDYWNARLGGLMQKGDKVTKDDILNEMAHAMTRGVLSPTAAQQEVQSIPEDPKQYGAYVRQHYLATQDNARQIELLTPSQEIIDPSTGAKRLVSKAELLGITGGQNPIGGANAQGGSQNAPMGGQNQSTGGFQTTLGPGQQAALTTGGTNQANAAQNLHDVAADVPIRINYLEQARENLANPGVQTGPGTDWRNQMKSFMNSLAPDVVEKVAGKDFKGEIKDYDEFKKIMTNYASLASAGLGTGTDARLNAALTGNANPSISKLANEDILTKNIAIEKMRQAQDYAWQNSGAPADQFNKWQSQWNKQINPDAFVFSVMTPAQQKSFIERQNATGTLPKFKKDLVNMVKQGFLEAPGQ